MCSKKHGKQRTAAPRRVNLLRDGHDWVTSATITSPFAVFRGELLMPALGQSGVAGVAQAGVSAMYPGARTVELRRDALSATSVVFRGPGGCRILPLQSLDGPNFVSGAVAPQSQQSWRNPGLVMGQGG